MKKINSKYVLCYSLVYGSGVSVFMRRCFLLPSSAEVCVSVQVCEHEVAGLSSIERWAGKLGSGCTRCICAVQSPLWRANRQMENLIAISDGTFVSLKERLCVYLFTEPPRSCTVFDHLFICLTFSLSSLLCCPPLSALALFSHLLPVLIQPVCLLKWFYSDHPVGFFAQPRMH